MMVCVPGDRNPEPVFQPEPVSVTTGGIEMIGDWIDQVEYPQAPTMTEDEVVSFFEQTTFARLGTINEDGTVHLAPIFFKYQDGQIIMATQAPSRKVRNLERDNKVSVLIDTTDVPFKGALIYGKAELDYENAASKRVAIFERRLSTEDSTTYARRLAEKWRCVIIRITPNKIVSFDYSKA